LVSTPRTVERTEVAPALAGLRGTIRELRYPENRSTPEDIVPDVVAAKLLAHRALAPMDILRRVPIKDGYAKYGSL
jgi:hypothetical protein